MPRQRAPVRAGTFYPADARQLVRTVDTYLAQVEPKELSGDPIGLICPHAGYIYSGQTAAYGYALVRDALAQGRQFDLAVVLSPAHYAMAGRFLVSNASAYQTPLGSIELDHQAIETLDRELGLHRIGFDQEHAIEVQLPFLQVVLKPFTLLPIMIADLSLGAGEELGTALSKVLVGRNALIIASTDLHHIPNYDQVVRRDGQVIEALDSGDLARIKRSLSARDCSVCGRVAIVSMLTAAEAAGANRVDILHYTNSGNVTGNRAPGQYTVGYVAAAAIRE
jgi:AmmeMemoRadiSam system protein B